MSDHPETGSMSILDAVENLGAAEEAQPVVETEEAPEAEAQAEPVESTEEAPAEPENEAESEESTPEAEDEGPQHLDLETYGDLTIPIVVNGEESRVRLADAAKGFRLESDYTRKTMELADQRKALEAERAELSEQSQRQQEQIAQLLASQTEPEPDWVKMAEEDPLGYVETKAKWEAKQSERQRVMQEVQQRRTQERQAEMMRETQLLMEKAPEFKDQDFQGKFLSSVVEGYGFKPEEVRSAFDHRILLMAADAMKWRQSQQQVKEKVVVKSPKVIKPGTARGKSEIKAEQVAARNRKLAKPHSVDEHLEALFGE